MKKFLFFLLMIFPLLMAAQQPIYSRVKIFTDNKSPALLFASGIEIVARGKENNSYLAEISQQEIKKLDVSGFRYEVLIPDMAKYYTERFYQKSAISVLDQQLSQTWPQPVNFSLGSCGGFSTVDEMTAQLDLMRSLYPSLISVKKALSDTITTFEGRTVYYVRISDNPDVSETEPEVLYTGMHHAREPISMQHLLYYMWYVLENYSTDPSVKALVDNTQMYFVPVFNVDGYTSNITNDPNGDGMWRKNRRDNGDGSFGVDINRNYGFQWGYDNSGSSPVPSSDTYRGTAPFSEPETRMMKYFCESHNFLIALNYHSFSNLFLYPWGWTAIPPADNATFDAYASLMTKENKYTYGPGSTTIYPTNGGSDDWMYGEQTTKPVILSYTPEVGGNSDGFWPAQDRILPLIRENMYASITAARLTGNYGTIADNNSLFIWEQSGFLTFDVKRLGLQAGDLLVSIAPLGNTFVSVGAAKVVTGLNLLEKRVDSISYQIGSNLNVGDTIQYVLTINNGYLTEYDTVMRIFGFPVPIFNDELTTISNWTGNWAITNTQYYSPFSSMTDSPLGNYTTFTTKTITLINDIELSNTLLVALQFRAKWFLEKDYDYVQVSISDDSGITWTALQGKHTHPGTTFQAFGEPVYDGQESDWVHEAISLKDYMGKKIKIRFRLKADGGTQMDGFYFDDFNISMLLDPTSSGETDLNRSMLGIPFPNPATSGFQVNYLLPANSSKAVLSITTMSGNPILTQELNKQEGLAKIDVSNIPAGMYLLRITSNGIQSPVRKLIVN